MVELGDETTVRADEAAPVPALRDEGGSIEPAFVAAVAEAIEAESAERLTTLLEDLHEADLGDLIEALEPADRPRLIELLGKDFDFTVLTEVDDSVREGIIEELAPATLAEGVRDLDSDDAVYILEDLDQEDRAEILDRLPASESAALRRALDYPEDSAGRRMQTEFIAVPAFWSVGETIDFMRETDDLPETFYEIFVVDPAVRLVGAVPLDRLLRSKRPVKIADIMNDEPDVVKATDERDDVALMFQRYNLVSAAVVDAGGRLVGVLTIDDIVDVIEDEADADIKALGGVNADEEISDNVWETVKSRFPWLFANVITAFASASVIRFFEGSLEKMVALAVLMPVVSAMGGNAGTQTMTVTVRALATRELGRANAWRIIRREMTVGILNGLAFGVLMGLIAAAWFRITDLGVVVALAMLAVLFAAAFGGILIPLALNKLGVDPAVSSGPFVTTTTDIVGFLAFLGIATMWFGLG